MSSAPLPSYADVEAAAERLRGVAHRTPVLTSSAVDARAGAAVFFKCENLQRVGAFKFRGAHNALSRLTPAQRDAGVVTWSSGNHAQAVALAARLTGVHATIVMPEDAPAPKLAATRGYGAEVVTYRRGEVVREELGARIARERGATIVPPYDHFDVIAGQGTAAKELIDEVGPSTWCWRRAAAGAFCRGRPSRSGRSRRGAVWSAWSPPRPTTPPARSGPGPSTGSTSRPRSPTALGPRRWGS